SRKPGCGGASHGLKKRPSRRCGARSGSAVVTPRRYASGRVAPPSLRHRSLASALEAGPAGRRGPERRGQVGEEQEQEEARDPELLQEGGGEREPEGGGDRQAAGESAALPRGGERH